jgi:D-alanyl-D-alanine carboxypeptidase
MKRGIIMTISAVLLIFLVTAPDFQAVVEAVNPVETATPVIAEPALVYVLAEEDEPATRTSLKEIEREKYDNTWAFYLVDKHNPLPAGFEIALYQLGAGDEWWREIDARIADYTLRMLEDSRRDGVHIVVIEGFRTIERQQEIYDRRVNYYLGLGLNEAQAVLVTETEVAYPGASEHNAGFALDFASGNYNPYSFEQTAEFDWLLENSWKYGFILRYPDNAMHITGFIYEPWH